MCSSDLEKGAKKLAAEIYRKSEILNKYPRSAALKVETLEQFGDLSGKWYGVAYCKVRGRGRRVFDMEMDISKSGKNKFLATTLIQGDIKKLSEKYRIVPKDKRKKHYSLYNFLNQKTGKKSKSTAPIWSISKVSKIQNQSQYIKLDLGGECKEAY